MHVVSWLVHLAIGTKKRVHHWVRACAFESNRMPTLAHLNVLPLGSYNMLLGMDGSIFTRLRWIVMERPLSLWVKMENKESYRVRRRKH